MRSSGKAKTRSYRKKPASDEESAEDVEKSISEPVTSTETSTPALTSDEQTDIAELTTQHFKRKLEVETSAIYGRGIYAKESISAGSELIREDPYVKVVDDQHIETHCSQCMRAASPLRCSQCAFVRYCSQACQKKDWWIHKQECAASKRINPKLATTVIRVMARLIWKQHLKPETAKAVKQLQSHRANISDERYAKFEEMTILVYGLVGPIVERKEITELFCMFSCNSISICDGELVNIGVGVFPTLSLINHSCDPNAAIIVDGDVASLRSIKNISSGEQIFQSYIEVAEPRYVRRTELKDRYYFSCECGACQKDNEHRTGYWCVKPDCGGIIEIPEGPTNLECPKHGMLTNEESGKLVEQIKECFSRYRAVADIKSPPSALKPAQKCLAFQKTIMAPGNVELLRTKRLILDSALAVQDWTLAYATCQDLLASLSEIYSSHHPQLAIQSYMLYRLAEWAFPTDQELLLTLIGKAVDLLRVSHGERQPLAVEAAEALRNRQLVAQTAGLKVT
ncbi:hypothetical protein DFS34DRAFT_652019 [Phlyctochytrium arcticum]|nr:hypothetical protein DFS34DRAFT_652019 [Phlyctochytrium arcticum]